MSCAGPHCAPTEPDLGNQIWQHSIAKMRLAHASMSGRLTRLVLCLNVLGDSFWDEGCAARFLLERPCFGFLVVFSMRLQAASEELETKKHCMRFCISKKTKRISGNVSPGQVIGVLSPWRR